VAGGEEEGLAGGVADVEAERAARAAGVDGVTPADELGQRGPFLTLNVRKR
jgi:hypothetical protein